MKAKVSAVMRWLGPLAIVGAVLAVISDQVGLVVHLPEMGEDSMGYHAVGSGIFLFIVTLLFIGMLGLYIEPPSPKPAKLLEYGGPNTRYVLVELDDDEPRTAMRQAPARHPVNRPVRRTETKK